MCTLLGCRDEGETRPPRHPPEERLNDPAYRQAITNEAAVRKQLLKTRSRLEAQLEAAKKSGDAAEAKSLEGRIAEVNEAIDDVRRHMLKTMREKMNRSNDIRKFKPGAKAPAAK